MINHTRGSVLRASDLRADVDRTAFANVNGYSVTLKYEVSGSLAYYVVTAQTPRAYGSDVRLMRREAIGSFTRAYREFRDWRAALKRGVMVSGGDYARRLRAS